MDTFTVSMVDPAQAAPNPTPVAATKTPSKSFRVIFLVLLLAVLVSAGATTWIILGWPKNAAPLTPTEAGVPAGQANPFAVEPDNANPFADTAESTQSATTNPFDASATDSANPFDQFETTSSSTSSVNPF